MILKEQLTQLSNRESIGLLKNAREKVQALNLSESDLLDLTNEMFKMGSKSHLNSLNPLLRKELGFQLDFMTRHNPPLQLKYREKKNEYLGLGKSFAAISFLFDLIKEQFSSLDLVLMHEILMDDGKYRVRGVYIDNPDGKRKRIPADNIDIQVEELIKWYYEKCTYHDISPIVLASLFHYYLLTIHPFIDGNGRVSRLFQNLILLKDGLFPIIIPSNKRQEYYAALLKADNNEFESLIDLIAALAKEKLEEYIKLTEGLLSIDNDIECLVLTEDGNTTMIKNLLAFHGFEMKKTRIESYEGKDNIASATFLARKMREKKPNLKHIILHRDRDNDLPQQLQQIIGKLIKNNDLLDCSTIFITKYYDMECYFLNENHINEIFPEITKEKALQLIFKATSETSETSKQKLRIALYDFGKYSKIDDPQEKATLINDLYESDPVKYRYGKAVLYKLEELIALELGVPDKISIVKKSSHIKVDELKKAKQKLEE